MGQLEKYPPLKGTWEGMIKSEWSRGRREWAIPECQRTKMGWLKAVQKVSWTMFGYFVYVPLKSPVAGTEVMNLTHMFKNLLFERPKSKYPFFTKIHYSTVQYLAVSSKDLLPSRLLSFSNSPSRWFASNSAYRYMYSECPQKVLQVLPWEEPSPKCSPPLAGKVTLVSLSTSPVSGVESIIERKVLPGLHPRHKRSLRVLGASPPALAPASYKASSSPLASSPAGIGSISKI